MAERKSVNVVVSEEDYAWLKNEAENGPYGYASTLARYLLAEAIKSKRDSASVKKDDPKS